MKTSEVKALASQVDLEVRSADDLCKQVKIHGWDVGVNNHTGHWVILSADRSVLAEVA